MDGSRPKEDVDSVIVRVNILLQEMLLEIAEIKARLAELEAEREHRTVRQPH